MAKPTLLLISILFAVYAISQKPSSFTLNGRFDADTLTGKVYLNYAGVNGFIRDSSEIKGGKFSFKGQIAHPVLAGLNYARNEQQLFIGPGNQTIRSKNTHWENAEIKGTSATEEFDVLDKAAGKINKRWSTVKDTLYAVNKRSNTAFQELKGWVLEPYFEEMREAYLDFFEKYPRSYVTAYFLSFNIIELNQGDMPTEKLNEYYAGFPGAVKNSIYGKGVAKQLEKRKIAVPGTDAIDFAKKDLNGNQLSLSSFRGKYVLLDFWGSWCVPCRKGNPHLKELYQRYKDKGFDIIGIAADNDTPDAWKKAIEKDGLPWHHILLDDLNKKYNIGSYPTKILIDKNGKIIGRYGSEEKELDEMLSKIFDNATSKN
ncbi:MAG: TlpA disulfide reductase family protein [Chitinophagaceae bacterium]